MSRVFYGLLIRAHVYKQPARHIFQADHFAGRHC